MPHFRVDDALHSHPKAQRAGDEALGMWTLAGSYQSAIRANLDMKAGQTQEAPTYYDKGDGVSTPNIGSQALGPALLNAMFSVPGNGRVSLPARASVGVRQRFNQIMTWEADLRYIAGAGFELPSQPSLLPPSGIVTTPGVTRHARNGYGISGVLELTLTKNWTARMGMEFMSALFDGSTTEPFVGGAPTSGFSFGASYKALGGEWSLGYQYRQSQDQNSQRLDGVWKAGGYSSSGTTMAVEGMGHLMSIGFKKAF